VLFHDALDQLTTGEHARLKKTQEETSRNKTAVVLNQTLEESSKAEEEHVQAEPDMGLEALEKNVGGNLKEDVWHEEDDEGGIVFCLFEAEFFGQANNVGIGDVYTICKSWC
jgi:hypothetical protein